MRGFPFGTFSSFNSLSFGCMTAPSAEREAPYATSRVAIEICSVKVMAPLAQILTGRCVPSCERFFGVLFGEIDDWRKPMRGVFWMLASLFGWSTAHADNLLDRDEIAAAFGWDFETAEIQAEEVRDGLYVLFGLGGNIAASIGEDGVLIVDDQFPQIMPKIEAKIAELGGGAIDFAINTHWHFDHADGNLALGPKGVWLVSQANSRAMMTGDHIIDLVAMQYRQQAYPENARPAITYDDEMQFHFNGERIDLLHFGPAHTTGDTVVIFRGANAVHFGDVFNNTGYPFIDAGNGGDLDGMIEFCKAALAEIDENTVVIPGHGALSNYQGLVDYIDMLQTVRDRIVNLIAEGADLEAVIAAKPTADLDERYGDPTLMVNRSYTSLMRENANN